MKQRTLLFIFLLLSTLTTNAYDAYIDGIYYNLNTSAKTATVTFKDYKLNSYTGSVLIPAFITYNGVTYSVSSIDLLAFSNCPDITSIIIESGNKKYDSRDNCNAIIETASNTLIAGSQNTVIPNNVTSISNYAFAGCSKLTSVTIPNSVTSIGNGAFNVCSSLTEVTIPKSVTSIGVGAFSACSGLTSIIVESGNKKYDSRDNCNALIETETNTLIVGCQKTVIPNGVTSIENSAFLGCSGLTSVTIPNSVTTIGNYAFSGCTNLTSIVIPNSVTSIGEDALRNCTGELTINCNIPSSYNSIFSNSKFASVKIGDDVEEIGKYVFRGCSSLTSVTIGNSLTSIGEGTFYDCTGLTSITIGNSVISIETDAFINCTGLTSVHIKDISTWCNINFVPDSYFRNEGYCSNPLYHAQHLFMDDREIINLVIPGGVKSINKYAFCNGSYLESVTIPNSVTAIGSETFSGCTRLKEVTIGNSVKEINSYAFKKCSVLTDVYCYAKNVPTLNSDAFDGSNVGNAALHVPQDALLSYLGSSLWRAFGNIVALQDSDPKPEPENEPGMEKCATPVISIVAGRLNISCETEDVEYICRSEFKTDGNNVMQPQKLQITVTATKEGYVPSDFVTAEIDLSAISAIKGDVNADGTVNGTDIQEVINIIVGE